MASDSQQPRYPCPRTPKGSEEVHFGDIDISTSTPSTDVKLAPKCLFSRVLCNDIKLYLKGGRTEKSIFTPLCFEKVFFIKISLRGLQWHIMFP